MKIISGPLFAVSVIKTLSDKRIQPHEKSLFRGAVFFQVVWNPKIACGCSNKLQSE